MIRRTTDAARIRSGVRARGCGSSVVRSIRPAIQTLRTARRSFVMMALSSPLLLSASCVIGKGQPMASDTQARFTGTWRIDATEPASVAQGARYLVFRPDGRYAALDPGGQTLWAGTYEIDPTHNPPIFDHRSDASLRTRGDALGIYRLSGDRLTVACVAGAWQEDRWSGRPRPARFVIDESDAVLHLQRVTQPPGPGRRDR